MRKMRDNVTTISGTVAIRSLGSSYVFDWLKAVFGRGFISRATHKAALLRMHEAERVKLRFMEEEIERLRKERDALAAREQQGPTQ